MSDEERLRAIETLLNREPSESRWRELCGHLAGMVDSVAIELGVLAVREQLQGWPARMRRAGSLGSFAEATAPWLARLFRGACDSRLELVGWAYVRHESEHHPGEDRFLDNKDPYGLGPDFSTLIRPVVFAFARHLQPDFAPPNVRLSCEGRVEPASGCGGGFEAETWGDAERGLRWHAMITEHAADYSSDGAWTVYGLNEGLMLKVGDRERGAGTYTFEAEGPTPEVLELALAWGELLRVGPGWSYDEALDCLARVRCLVSAK